jgi:hypothetical protein
VIVVEFPESIVTAAIRTSPLVTEVGVLIRRVFAPPEPFAADVAEPKEGGLVPFVPGSVAVPLTVPLHVAFL